MRGGDRENEGKQVISNAKHARRLTFISKSLVMQYLSLGCWQLSMMMYGDGTPFCATRKPVPLVDSVENACGRRRRRALSTRGSERERHEERFACASMSAAAGAGARVLQADWHQV